MTANRDRRREFRLRQKHQLQQLQLVPQIEYDVPAGMSEDDILPGVSNPIFSHYAFVWRWLDDRFPNDPETFWASISQLPPREGSDSPHPRGGEWHGWSGPAIGFNAAGGYVYADYGSLEISEPCEEAFQSQALLWPPLISEFAPANLVDGGLEDLAEYLRYFDRDSFAPATLNFIDGVAPHRS